MADVTAEQAAYPKRPRFFAHRYIRLIARVCLANEIGPEACWLLTLIANTEDAKHYRDAVTYFNGQLINITGFGSVSSLGRFRQKAVDAGWLHYEAGVRRKAGRYWVMIPERFQDVQDGPIDHDESEYAVPFPSANGMKRHSDDSDFIPLAVQERDESAQESGRKAVGKRDESAHPSIPSPSPSPIPSPKAEESPEPSPTASGPTADPPVMEFPCNGSGAKVWHLHESKVAEYRASFPGVNLDAELRKARQWAIDNPSKRKTHRGTPAFLTRWLSKAQDEAGPRLNASARSPPRGLDLQDQIDSGEEFIRLTGGRPQ